MPPFIRKTTFFLGLIMLLSNCREPFGPDFKTGQNDYLVVEGFIHIGIKAVTKIELSRVAPLENLNQVHEPDAIVEIENETGDKFLLQEKTTGIYLSDSLSLDPMGQYRLLITTQNGKHYASNSTGVKATPPIDSVYWQFPERLFVNISVASHDDEKETQYYKWEYVETWEIRSDYYSKYAYESDTGLYRRNVLQMFDMQRCWKSQPSVGLKFATTASLDADRIQYQLASISPYATDRFSFLYTILVEQRTLSKEEFEYLQIMEKNSTITGSLFDPMPSEIYGNLRSLDDPDEYVVGFMGAHTTSMVRIWIEASDIKVFQPRCDQITVQAIDFETFFGAAGAYTPIDSLSSGVTAAFKKCMDCRLRGGNPDEPDFWDN